MKYINYILPYWPYIVAIVIALYLAKRFVSVDWLKTQAVNIRRHKVMFSFMLVFLCLSVYLFNANYAFRSPIVAKHEAQAQLAGLTGETPQMVWNDRADCYRERDELKAELAE